jgi:ribosome-associated translation inhibitor RaiA
MLLTPEHRRSNRRRVKRTGFDMNSFIEENKVETIPGKLYRLETKNVEVETKNVEVKEEESQEAKVDVYADCPEHAGYEYDKDMYLANDRYASVVDKDIATLKDRESIRRSTYFSRKERFYDASGNQI